MKAIGLGLVLVAAIACGEHHSYGGRATCVNTDGETVYDGEVFGVYVSGNVTTVTRPDMSRLTFTGQIVRCVIEHDPPEE